MNRLLITGAAGTLGSQARERCKAFADIVRLNDIADLGQAGNGEEIAQGDLSNHADVSRMVQGCDGIVHFGGFSHEGPFDPILKGNIIGVYNLYEAARAHNVNRIFFASSNHAVGFHPVSDRLDEDALPFADSLYGASKVYGEQIALLYWKKFGIETARVRIGSSFERPRNRRMLNTWMSFEDMFALVKRIFEVPRLGCPVIYGQSANTATQWNNDPIHWLGWQPKDSSEPFRQEIEAADPHPDPNDSAYVYHGGTFVDLPIEES